MIDSPRLAGRSAVAVLFATAACALGVATTTTASALSRPEPERCCAAVSASGRVTPTARPATSRPAGPPLCVIGSWRTVDESFMIKFYTDRSPIRFTGRGREFEFRPDGTVLEKQDNVVLTANFEGRELRMVGNGTSELTWTATDRAITYPARTRVSFTWSYYDQRGLINTDTPGPEPALNEVDDYTCSGSTMSESNAGGYRSTWVRTAAYGVYG